MRHARSRSVACSAAASSTDQCSSVDAEAARVRSAWRALGIAPRAPSDGVGEGGAAGRRLASRGPLLGDGEGLAEERLDQRRASRCSSTPRTLLRNVARATARRAAGCPAVAATSARSSGSGSWVDPAASLERGRVGLDRGEGEVAGVDQAQVAARAGRPGCVRAGVSCEDRADQRQGLAPEVSKTAMSRRCGRGSWSSVVIDPASGRRPADDVGAGLVEPGRVQSRQVAPGGSAHSTHQVVEPGVGEGVAAK